MWVLLNILSLLMAQASAAGCPSGQSFDSVLNRCITTEETGQILSAVQNCSGDKECYRQNAENALKEAEGEGKVKAELANSSGLLNTSMKAAAVAVPLAMGMAMLKNVAKRGGTKCAAPSIYAMFGGGIAMVAGDLISNTLHKSRLKKIDSDWSSVKGSETQSEAFEFLAKREDSMAKSAQMKTMFYGAATLAFGASAVMSTLEAIRLDQPNVVCKVDEKAEDEAWQKAQDAKDAELAAKDAADAAKEAADAANAAKDAAGSAVSPDHFIGPFERWDSLIEGNLTHLQIKNLMDAKDLASFVTLSQEFSTGKAQTVDQFRVTKEFLEGSGIEHDPNVLAALKNNFKMMVYELSPVQSAHAQEVGEDIIVTGKRMPRVKGLSKFLLQPVTRAVISGMFSAWAGVMALHAAKQAKVSKNRAEYLRKMKDEFKVAQGSIAQAGASASGAAAAGKFQMLNGATLDQPATCISKSGDADPNCDCRKANTCLSSGLAGINGLNASTMSVLSSGLTPLDQLGNGTAAAGSISAAGATSNAIRLLQTAKKVAASSPKGADLVKKTPELAMQVSNSMMKASEGFSTPALANSSALPLSPTAAKDMLEKEISRTAATGSDDSPVTASGVAQESTLEAAIAENNQVNEVLKQDMDFGQNDVHADPGKNIFEVLSNRYQQSGMRRLFEAQ